VPDDPGCYPLGPSGAGWAPDLVSCPRGPRCCTRRGAHVPLPPSPPRGGRRVVHRERERSWALGACSGAAAMTPAAFRRPDGSSAASSLSAGWAGQGHAAVATRTRRPRGGEPRWRAAHPSATLIGTTGGQYRAVHTPRVRRSPTLAAYGHRRCTRRGRCWPRGSAGDASLFTICAPMRLLVFAAPYQRWGTKRRRTRSR
jgi:hypothetical protein